MRQINALLRFYFHIDPDELSDDEWAKRWAELRFCLEMEAEKMKL